MGNKIRSFVAPLFRIMPSGFKGMYYDWRNRQIDRQILLEWKEKGRPVPPPHIVKQQTIFEFKDKFACSTFVETGTFMGDMVKAQLKNFDRIYSIELGQELWENAVKRFNSNSHVTILQGDSGDVLNILVPKLTTPCIFWLDGHYSEGITAKGKKECPIYEELNSIFTSQLNHILLIDDARCFNGVGDYPTIEQLSQFVLSHRPKSVIDIKDDIIRIECK